MIPDYFRYYVRRPGTHTVVRSYFAENYKGALLSYMQDSGAYEGAYEVSSDNKVWYTLTVAFTHTKPVLCEDV